MLLHTAPRQYCRGKQATRASERSTPRTQRNLPNQAEARSNSRVWPVRAGFLTCLFQQTRCVWFASSGTVAKLEPLDSARPGRQLTIRYAECQSQELIPRWQSFHVQVELTVSGKWTKRIAPLQAQAGQLTAGLWALSCCACMLLLGRGMYTARSPTQCASPSSSNSKVLLLQTPSWLSARPAV